MKSSQIFQSSSSYWDSKVEDFDAIYSGENWAKAYKLLSDILRKDIFDRLTESVNIARQYQQPISILDVGCGTARFVEKIYPTNHFVVGLDYSSRMLEKARQNLNSKNIPQESYKLICGDAVNDWPSELDEHNKFELILMLGLVEYISNPLPLLQKMLRLSPEKMVVAFCRNNTIRCHIRRWRYKIQGLDCPLFFYSKNDIYSFGKELGAKSTEIKVIGQQFFTVYSF